ncbi:DUF6328 family protein [Tessaracoccus sp. OS52]|uniref:DUF6328 family protein n=1 Tax=Tessaracoccus sp. OS52 TaxID=2886691 RepID=UPI001D11FDF9|nr:DUF6328 family protein [Tessaracoccus sp. OS52]MCC2592395.1 DUF6328 family protein [Tessaracoccus sp. OS52]
MGPQDKAADSGSQRRHETEAERLDRNWGELLQEFRVAQTGIQILFGFLLILPFQSGFGDLDASQRLLYLIVFACMTASTICILAPVIAHRILFRQRAKDRLVDFGSHVAKASIGFLGAAFVGAVGLIVSLVVGVTTAWISAGATFLVIVVLWLVVPLTVLPKDSNDERSDQATQPGTSR